MGSKAWRMKGQDSLDESTSLLAGCERTASRRTKYNGLKHLIERPKHHANVLERDIRRGSRSGRCQAGLLIIPPALRASLIQHASQRLQGNGRRHIHGNEARDVAQLR